MKYFSLELSKKLAAKGLVSESEMYYSIEESMTESGNPKSYVKKEHYEVYHVADPMAYKRDCFYPAFTLSDILLNKDNAIKLWGEEIIDPESETEAWYFEAASLFEIYHEGGDVEAELLKAL